MKRSASDDDTAADDAEDKAEGKRSKVDGDTTTQHDATASNSNTQESSGSLEVAGALLSERAAPVLLGSAGTVAVASGEEQSSSCELGGDGGSGPEAQPSLTAGAGVGAGTNGTKENNHGPQSCSARAGSTGESSNAATGHTFDTMEDIDILEYTRDHSGSLTFPEKLMLMLLHIAKYYREIPEQAPTAWVDDGTAFVVHNTDRLCSDWIPLFFRPCKFSSFKRKLFRWEFRLGAVSSKDLIPAESQEIVFCNENFKRDNKNLLTHMQSVTAEKNADKFDLELAANMSDEPWSPTAAKTASRSPTKGRGRSRSQKQQNRRLQEPPPSQILAGATGGLLHHPYSSMLPHPSGIDLIHSLQLHHGQAAASFLHHQAPPPIQHGGMTTIPSDPLARHVLAEAAAKAAAAGHQPGQLLLTLPELQELMARGGQHPSQATHRLQHSAPHVASVPPTQPSSSTERNSSTATAKEQQPFQDFGDANANTHDNKGGESGNDKDGEKQQQQTRQTTTNMLPSTSDLLAGASRQQHQQNQSNPLLSSSQEGQLQDLLAWQSRQLSQLGVGGYPPPFNGGGGGGGPDLLSPHRTPQEEQLRQLLLGAATSGAPQGQQQQNLSFGSGGGSGVGSHFGGLPGNPW